MSGIETKGCAPISLFEPGAQVQIDDQASDMQEEALSAGESRRGVAVESLWSLAAVDPLEMASLIAGWGDPERSLAQVLGPPGWRNGDLKVELPA